MIFILGGFFKKNNSFLHVNHKRKKQTKTKKNLWVISAAENTFFFFKDLWEKNKEGKALNDYLFFIFIFLWKAQYSIV